MSIGEKIPIAAESSSIMMVFLFSFVVVFMSGLVPLFYFVFFRLGGDVGRGAREMCDFISKGNNVDLTEDDLGFIKGKKKVKEENK